MDWTIRSLIDELNRLTALYDAGTPEISDKEWDNLYFKLVEMEKEEGIIYPDSPTQSIQFKTVSKLEKKEHNHPMLSLAKTKDSKEIEKFVSGYSWFAMFKMDGLTCSLTYENGELISAETRGNGYVGEDILNNVLVLPSVPKKIPNKELIVIDGEIVCQKNIFDKYYASEYKHPRNFASGNIRQLNNKDVGELTFVAWDLVKGCDDIDFIPWRFEELVKWGFYIVPFVGDAETIDDALECLDGWKEISTYPIDGYVFKFTSKKFGESLGRTDHHFKNAIAYKFYDETYSTKLITIQWTMGRTGVLTPVAIFRPVEIDGTMVSRASLHNVSIMKQILGECAYVGEPLEVYKANMIIPQIESAGPKHDYDYVIAHGGISANDNPEVCPYCGAPTKIVVSADGIENMTCSNANCESKLSNKIDHFFGKKGLDAKGISKATIDKLIDWGWVSSIYDMFDLHLHKAEWIKKPGFGEKSVTKIIESISESRYCTLDKFISAIGIPLVGQTIAREIVKYYSTWNDFMDAIGGDWSEFEGFGPEISNSINEYDYTEAKKIEKILQIQYIEEKPIEIIESPVKGKTFVITGKLNHFSNRDALKTNIEVFGGKVAGSISSKTDYLINNDINSTSSKNIKAKQLNIPIITEDQYLKWVE